MEVRKGWLVSVLLLLGLILAACNGASNVVDQAPVSGGGEPDVVQAPEEPQVEEANPAPGEPEPEAVQPAPVVPEPGEGKPVPRAGLAATDPASVDLSAGKPTLVEFFAFW